MQETNEAIIDAYAFIGFANETNNSVAIDHVIEFLAFKHGMSVKEYNSLLESVYSGL